MKFLFTRFLIVLLLKVCTLSTQQSSCRYFEYKYDQSGVHGYIEFNLNGRASSVMTVVNFTIATQLPSNYAGTLEYLGSQLRNGGTTVSYNVHFPVSRPLPKLTDLMVNNNLICSGAGDVLGPQGGYISTISLRHRQQLGSSFYNDFNIPTKIDYSPNTDLVGGSGISGGVGDGDTGNRNQDQWEADILSFTRPTNNPTFRPRPPSFSPPSFSPPVVNPPRRPPPQFYDEPIYVPPPPRNVTTTQPPPPLPSPASSNPAECGLVGGAHTLIVEGDSYDRGEWPWLVALYRRKDGNLNFICGGTLVSDRHVITAAHCMQQKSTYTELKDIVVRVGAHNLEDWADEYTITRSLSAARIHESYNAETVANDILILTFNKKVTFSNYIRPICLWTGNNDLEKVVGKKGVVAGWGKSEFGPSGKGEPRAVRIPIVSTTTCRSSRPDFNTLTSSYTLCAGGRDGSGPCFGDSGGGLYVHDSGRWRLRGIVSVSLRPDNGDFNCNLEAYLVFTDAAQYLPWINNNLDVKRR